MKSGETESARRVSHPRRSKLSWIGTALLVAVLVLAWYYADLLRAAITPNPIPQSAESIAKGRAIFLQNCVVCHGPGGHGDGVAAAALPKRPKDLAALAPPPIFPDGVVAYRIANGKGAMPAWKAVLSEQDIWDLLNFIRSLHEAVR
jgi:mono/diheme cytochrome c family protein